MLAVREGDASFGPHHGHHLSPNDGGGSKPSKIQMSLLPACVETASVFPSAETDSLLPAIGLEGRNPGGRSRSFVRFPVSGSMRSSVPLRIL